MGQNPGTTEKSPAKNRRASQGKNFSAAPTAELGLTEEAYERLKAWKESPNDSFSGVVVKRVPKRGTGIDMSEGFKSLPSLTADQAQILETMMTID